MQKLFRVTVDISKKIPAPAFEVNTNDLKSVKLEITITNGQSLLDLTDVTPRINIRKPDNEVIFQDCEIVDATAGKVEIILENQAYLVPGTHTAEIACYKGNEITAITGTFSYKSIKGIMNDEAVESRSEFTVITRTLNEAKKAIEDAKEAGGFSGVDEQARQEIQEVAGVLETLATKTELNRIVESELGENHTIRELPNGVQDEVSDTEIIKKVSENIKTDSSKIGLYTEETNVGKVVFSLTNFTNVAPQTAQLDGSVIVAGKTETTEAISNNTTEVGKFYTNATQLVFIVAKGTYTTTTNARNNFPVQTINYQLATPSRVQLPPSLSPNTKEILRISKKLDSKPVDEEATNTFQVKNELLNAGFLGGTSSWLGNQGSTTASGGVLTLSASAVNRNLSLTQTYSMVVGHKYYLSFQINPFRTHIPMVRMDAQKTTEQEVVQGQFNKVSIVLEPTSTRAEVTFYANGFADTGMVAGSQTKFKEMLLVDLTKTFGAGNEPTKEKLDRIFSYLPGGWFEKEVNQSDWQRALTNYILNFNRTPQTPEVPEGVFATRQTSLEYKQVDGNSWKRTNGTAMSVPDTDRVVHTVELSGLNADTEYEFRLIDKEYPTVYLTWNGDPSTTMVIHWHTFKPHPTGDYTQTFSNTTHKFRTMPKTLTSSIKFAQITDTHGSLSTRPLLEDLASKGVRCMIHSGDVATGHDGTGRVSPASWYQFFSDITAAVDPNGCIIPILANIGNHEVLLGSGGMEWDDVNDAGNKPDFDNEIRGDAEWYYCFFPSFPGLRGYGVIDFGDYASVWQLDPGITTPSTGAQSEFIVNSLAERVDTPHKIISYHYSPYPSGRRSAVGYYSQLRRNWVPLYQDYKPLVISGHDHVWSKTVPIYNDVRDDEKGIVFMTSGPTIKSTDARPGRNPHTKWYLEDSRASMWEQFAFEKPTYVGGYGEIREPHELDGTTFTNEEVANWLQIEIDYDKRVMTSFDGNKNVIHSFTQTVDPYTTN